jgi:hypothetical protein
MPGAPCGRPRRARSKILRGKPARSHKWPNGSPDLRVERTAVTRRILRRMPSPREDSVHRTLTIFRSFSSSVPLSGSIAEEPSMPGSRRQPPRHCLVLFASPRSYVAREPVTPRGCVYLHRSPCPCAPARNGSELPTPCADTRAPLTARSTLLSNKLRLSPLTTDAPPALHAQSGSARGAVVGCVYGVLAQRNPTEPRNDGVRLPRNGGSKYDGGSLKSPPRITRPEAAVK